MNLRHAAALALVGWYLMIPPTSNGLPLADAPLNLWVQIDTFDTADFCHRDLITGTEGKRRWMGDAATFAVLKEARCIASDDPRLKEK